MIYILLLSTFKLDTHTDCCITADIDDEKSIRFALVPYFPQVKRNSVDWAKLSVTKIRGQQKACFMLLCKKSTYHSCLKTEISLSIKANGADM